MLIRFRKEIIASLVILGLLLSARLFFFAAKPYNNEKYRKEFKNYYKVYSLNLPDSVSFAGEKVPLHRFDVRENLEKELLNLTYNQQSTIVLHKKAKKWFAFIVPILKKNSIPEDFKYMALAESGFTDEYSKKGAGGFWQFMENTALNYQLKINDEIDERFHARKSTLAACKLLRDLKSQLPDWTLAAAAFNKGAGGIMNCMNYQKCNNYFDLELGNETNNYIYKILALKLIIENPSEYGYRFRKKDFYPIINTITLKIDTPVHNLSDFSIKAGYNYKTLLLFNPWLKSNTLGVKEPGTYEIEFPANPDDSEIMQKLKGQSNES